jgi:hypothetical protein
MPAAEVEVSADLVRRLLAGQHRDLARLPVEFLANGWDNELYRVGDGHIARAAAPRPRRADAIWPDPASRSTDARTDTKGTRTMKTSVKDAMTTQVVAVKLDASFKEMAPGSASPG